VQKHVEFALEMHAVIDEYRPYNRDIQVNSRIHGKSNTKNQNNPNPSPWPFLSYSVVQLPGTPYH
jgi:hypothetical protein